jgi:hypothetical protein
MYSLIRLNTTVAGCKLARSVQQPTAHTINIQYCSLVPVSITVMNHSQARGRLHFNKRPSLFPCLHRASIESKNTFIVPTDAQYYKIIEMLKQFKIITLIPTCFGSRRNHHQGAVLCLTKTTIMFFLCSSVYNIDSLKHFLPTFLDI